MKSQNFLLLIVILSLIIFNISCSEDTGACVGTGGIVDTCKENWTKDECKDWDNIKVNGSNWIFHSGDSCNDRGYPIRCPDGTYVKSSGAC